MKSRFLASTIFLMLLGLFSTNLFAQITDASSVDFQIRNAVSGWRAWTSPAVREDTVGREVQYQVGFYAATQNAGLTKYTVTLPQGTITDTATLKNNLVMTFFDHNTKLLSQVALDPALVSVAGANEWADYSASGVSQVVVTADRDKSTMHGYTITLTGLRNPLTTAVNTKEHVALAKQKHMLLIFNHNETLDGTYRDSSFFVTNDKADQVAYNVGVQGYIDENFWPSGDSIYITDQWGNIVPDFLRADTDSLIISVAGDQGLFTDITNPAAGSVYLDTVYAGPVENARRLFIRGDASGSTVNVYFEAAAMDSGLGAPLSKTKSYILHRYTVSDSDNNAVIVYFGQYGMLPNGAGGLGVIFNADAGLDSTVFTLLLKGNVATDSIIGAKPTNTTTLVRDILDVDIASKIGTLTFSLGLGPHYNAKTDISPGFSLTLQDVFADPMSGVIGTDTDSVQFYFKYWKSGAVVATTTSLLQAGGGVTSKYSRPAARFIGTNFKNVTSGNYGSKLVGGAVNAVTGAVTPLSFTYLGTTTETADSIMVTAVAMNNPDAVDTGWITVLPSPPVAFDLDTFSVNLQTAIANISVVEGAQIPVDLPIFALDTAYNRVTNMVLTHAGGFLDNITINNTSIPAIDFLIDDRDPLGYGDLGVTDSIKIDSLGVLASGDRATAAVGLYGASVLSDSSFIWNHTQSRADKSRINLGGAGDDPMGLRLLYQGVNYKVGIEWDPGSYGDYVLGDFASRSIDLGLFTLASIAAVDSVENILASSDTAGAVTDLVVNFIPPAGSIVGPNLADSLVTISFIDLPEGAGILAGITVDSVECSTDNVNFYDALGVEQTDNSITLAVSVTATGGVPYFVRILDFVNPTKSDTSYGVQVSTEASPIVATNLAAMMVTDASFGGIKILNPGGTMPAAPDYFSEVVQSVDTLIAGDSTLFKIVLGDKHGNVINAGAGSRGLIFLGPDTTLTNMSTVVSQRSTLGTGGHMYDSLWVSYDTLSNGEYSIIDSIFIVPAMATSYSLVVMDSADNTISDEVSLVVMPTVTGSIALVDSLGLSRTAKATEVDTAFKVTLRDTYGNLLPDSVVRYVVAFGEGTFVDSNGSTVTVPNDTLSVPTDANGQASATLKTGATALADSIIVEVDVPSNDAVTAVKFYVTTRAVVDPGPSVVVIAVPPDSLVQDTTASVTITAVVRDNELVKEVYLRAITTDLVLDTGTGLFSRAAVSDTSVVDTTILGAAIEEVDFVGLIPAQDLATEVVYDIKVVDNIDSLTWSAQGTYLISPKRGKMDLTADAVGITDLMRAVYLYLDSPELTPGLVKRVLDYLGLDLNQDGQFDITNDVFGIRDIWKGVSTVLASATEQQNRTAMVSLSYEAVDKANAILSINLENQGNLMIAGFRVQYDADEFVFGQAQLAERLEGSGLEVLFGNNETEGVYSIVVLNLNGGMITSGYGAILSIPVSAVGDKFDGEGEISLISAEFAKDVVTNIDAEALSPKAILPKAFALGQNYPNPFNPSTTIAFDIPEDKEAFVRLKVYNIRGQLVRTLVNETMIEGSYKIEWDGKDNNGRYVASGVYFYRIQTGEFSKIRKMVILK